MKNWQDEANCIGVDPEFFYPVVKGENGEPVPNPDPKGHEFIADYSEQATAVARSYCNSCPVIFECLRRNLDDEHGIFADTNPEERRALKRKERKKK